MTNPQLYKINADFLPRRSWQYAANVISRIIEPIFKEPYKPFRMATMENFIYGRTSLNQEKIPGPKNLYDQAGTGKPGANGG